jgi:SAM-dependent methyltransferase
MNSASSWARYDGITEDYDRIAGPRFFEPVAAHLVRLLPLAAGHELLDVACGSGIVGEAAMRRVHGLRVVGADLSMPMMRSARRRGVRHLIAASALDLPFADCSFEHVTASFLMNHLSDPETAATSMMRVLRPNGTIGITSWSIGPSENRFGSAWKQLAETFLPREEFERAGLQSLPSEEVFRDGDALAGLLRATGFQLQRGETVRFSVEMDTRDYIGTRRISLSARFMRSRLVTQRWLEFEESVSSMVMERFGSRIQFETAVNFAIGVRLNVVPK